MSARISFADVVRQAREITSGADFFEFRSSYIGGLQDAVDASSETVLVPLRYLMRMNPLRIVPVRKVLKAVSNKVHKEIRIISSALPGDVSGVYGFVLDEGEFARIVINGSMNLCWKRFAITKELMHLYIGLAGSGGDVSGRTEASAADVVKNAVASRRVYPQKFDDPTEKNLDEESAALFMAIEVLIPWGLRSQLSEMLTNRATAYQIAKAFMVPYNFIEFIFHRPDIKGLNYLEYSTRVNMQVHVRM